MLLEVLFLSLLAGRLVGGKITRLTGVNLAAAELFILAFLVRASAPRIAGVDPNLGFAALLGAYLLILTALWRNRRAAHIGLMAVGVSLNLLVIALNRGMPVSALALTSPAGDGIHIAIDDTTRLAWLGDVILWPLPPPLRAFVSLGDLFLTAGVALMIVQGMMYVGRRRQGASDNVLKSTHE
jgi:hypothetical protein